MQNSQSRCNLSRRRKQLRAESSFRIFPSIAYDLPFEQNSTNPIPLEDLFTGKWGEKEGEHYTPLLWVFLASPSACTMQCTQLHFSWLRLRRIVSPRERMMSMIEAGAKAVLLFLHLHLLCLRSNHWKVIRDLSAPCRVGIWDFAEQLHTCPCD